MKSLLLVNILFFGISLMAATEDSKFVVSTLIETRMMTNDHSDTMYNSTSGLSVKKEFNIYRTKWRGDLEWSRYSMNSSEGALSIQSQSTEWRGFLNFLITLNSNWAVVTGLGAGFIQTKVDTVLSNISVHDHGGSNPLGAVTGGMHFQYKLLDIEANTRYYVSEYFEPKTQLATGITLGLRF